ncbi:inhibitor of nuclear factor kappa-B kinase subunit alpha-like isoform X1 [Clupea harengus]|uniref:Inhibitor of nuclear factor kappa-B kinase subunit alpha-like isoform X1 n=1 Tax=Clupea harengus TaxID=7950 RepID=A0A6P8F2I0_CLUHA|nr:inhibitor of nuclear factor kappa-B kinase subunit alpha-like isoform X1 [Clupea harengus]
MAEEDEDGEVVFSTCLPQPHHLSRAVVEPLEKILQLMLQWDPVKRGGVVHPNTKKPLCFELLDQLLSLKVVHVLNMGTARLHSFPLSPDESVNSLQTRVERETGVAARDQEILLKVGVSLDPRKPARQCVTEGLKDWDSNTVFLFDKTLTKYTGPFSTRQPSDKLHTIMMDPESQKPVASLKKAWGEAVNHVCSLREDYCWLFQGQRAAMLSLLHYNTSLTCRNEAMFAESDKLKSKLDFFKSCIQYDLEKYSDQMHCGISSEKMLKAWQKSELAAAALEEVAEVGHLDEETVALHSEIVELQRSPFARSQTGGLDKLEEEAKSLFRQLKTQCRKNESGVTKDSSEMVRIIEESAQDESNFLKDLYSHLEKILISRQKIMELYPRVERALDTIRDADRTVMSMQSRRQKEVWFLLKLACSSIRNSPAASPESASQSTPHWSPTPSSQPPSAAHPPVTLPSPSDSTARLLQENQSRLARFSSLLQEAEDHQAHSIVEDDWSWIQHDPLCKKKQQTLQNV